MDECIITGVIVAIVGLLLIVLIWELRLRRFKSSYDGELIVQVNDQGKKIFSLELDKSPAEIEELDVVSFKVKNSQVKHPL